MASLSAYCCPIVLKNPAAGAGRTRAVGLRAAYVIGTPRSGGGDCLRAGDELGEFPEVQSGSRQVEFVAGAARAAQSEPIELQDAFNIRCAKSISTFLR